MPKKRHVKPFKPLPPSASPTSNGSDKPRRSVNELLANLRATSAGPSAARAVPATTPSVPPGIREILQLPETPAPIPRRQARQRFDASGRRLPAGPPPPRSWTSRTDDGKLASGSQRPLLKLREPATAILPGIYLPEPGSLIDVVLRSLVANWEDHTVYNQYHIYYIPAHLKAPLISYLGTAGEGMPSLADLKTILLPPLLSEEYGFEDSAYHAAASAAVTYLDLTGAIGRSLKLKEVTDLLFPSKQVLQGDQELSESWDTVEVSSSPPRALLPNLTYLSLALDPASASEASWKQLLTLSSKLSSVTHLSLAFWPDPCLTPRSRYSTVTSSQGQSVPYGGTNLYSHTLDHDWSEALLVLRILSKNLYKLEFLDLTGCAAWFKALMEADEHDYVDWVGSWGKITHLKLYIGETLAEDSSPSRATAHREAIYMAAHVEKYIRSMRAGKGRFITVDRDQIDD